MVDSFHDYSQAVLRSERDNSLHARTGFVSGASCLIENTLENIRIHPPAETTMRFEYSTP